MKTKLLQWLFLFGMAVVLVAKAGAAAGQPAGQIKALRVRGNVFATDNTTKARTTLTDNADIIQGSTVTTAPGASVVLLFFNGATVNLGTDSELNIEQFTQNPFTETFNAATITAEPTASTTRLKLNRGELVSKVAKLNVAGGSTFDVVTPVGAAGIRGTTFRIVYRLDTTTGKALFSLSTLEGTVSVTLANGAVRTAAVQTTAGKEVVVTADVNVDASGNVTVTLPSGTTTVVATNTSTATTADVAAAANVIAGAVAAVVITPSAGSGTPAAPPPVPETQPIIQPINPTVVSPSQ